MTLRYWLIVLSIGAAFGASFAFNEVLLTAFGPLTVSFLRIAIGSAGCWLWILASRRPVRVPLGIIVVVAVFGAFQFAAPFAILPLAQQHITSSMAGIANAMTPVATVLISHVWPGGERANMRKLSGVAFGVAGIIVLASRGANQGDAEAAYVLFALGAPVCYGVALNLARRFVGLDSVVVTAWGMTGGLLLIAPFALVLEGAPAFPDVLTLTALVVIGVGLTSATFIAMYSILPVVGATNLSLVTFVAPLSATAIGVIAFGDALGAEHIGGMALILAGLLTIDGRILRRISPRAPLPIGGPHALSRETTNMETGNAHT